MFFNKLILTILFLSSSLNVSQSFNLLNGNMLIKKYRKRNEKVINLENSNKKIIYLGPGGFTMPYTLGICKYIKDNYDLSDYNFIGSSAGSWLAVYLASDINEQQIYNLLDEYSLKFETKNKFIHKWKHTTNFLSDKFKILINDKTFIQNKKIGISVTRYKNKKIKNEIINNYSSLEELLILCKLSSHIPILSGKILPRYNNIITIDSFFSEITFQYSTLIYFGSLNRTFTFKEIIGKTNIKATEYFNEGYLDAIKNKKYFDKQFNLN